jgi:hypothetical protein
VVNSHACNNPTEFYENEITKASARINATHKDEKNERPEAELETVVLGPGDAASEICRADPDGNGVKDWDRGPQGTLPTD